MNKKDLDALNELYLGVYSEEQLLNEAPLTPEQIKFRNERAKLGVISKGGKFVATGKVDPNLTSDWEWLTSSQAGKRQQLRAQKLAADLNRGQREVRISRTQDAAIAADKAEKAKANRPPVATPPAGSPPRPAASSTVLAKKGGVEGKLDKATGKFTSGAFSSAEKSRYASVAAQNAARNAVPKPPAQTSSPAIGKLGSTSFERRTPTSAELRAAQTARASGASPEKALQAAQKTNLPTQGPTPAIPDLKSVNADLAKFTPRDMNKYPIKPNPINNNKPNPAMKEQSHEWTSAKTLRDIAEAYQSVYEAKANDGNLANNYPPYDKVTRGDVIAGRLGKDEMGGKRKSVKKEEVELVDEKYMGFKKLKAAIAARGGVSDPGAVAASIGRKKYGKEKFQKAAAKGRKLGEENTLDEATAMAKRGYDEAPIRQRIAKSTGGGEAADRATKLENRPTYGNAEKAKQRQRYARAQRGDFRRTTSSSPGLHGYAHKSDDPKVNAKQEARGAQRGVLTPAEKKQFNREAYEIYEIVSSYLLENNFASSQENVDAIIENMSENWMVQILEETN